MTSEDGFSPVPSSVTANPYHTGKHLDIESISLFRRATIKNDDSSSISKSVALFSL